MPNYPGEYAQSLVRKTIVQAPVVPNYKTARFRSQAAVQNSSGLAEQTAMVTLENTGTASCIVQLMMTDDVSVNAAGVGTGAREWLGTAQSLVVGGRTTITVNPRRQYLEVHCNSGSGSVKVQLESQLRWDQIAFGKNDNTYPHSLIDPKWPTPLS